MRVSLAVARAAEIQCWFMAESNLILVMLLPPSFEAVLVQDACTSLPPFTALSFTEGSAGKVKFTLHPRVRSPSFAACAHADETPGAEDHKINVEATVVSSFLPCGAVVTRAGLQGSWGSSSKGVAGVALRLGAAPSQRKAPSPEPCSSLIVGTLLQGHKSASHA